MSSGIDLQALGKIAGLGGIAFGAFILIFRDVIRRNIFPKLKQDHAYRLITLIVSLTFAIAGIGVGSYVYLESRGSPGRVTLTFPQVSAQSAINAHLALIDQNRYGAAYDELSSDSKQRFARDFFLSVFEAQHAPHGRTIGRKLYGLVPADQLQGAPEGPFTIATYITDFEHGGRFVEIVITQAERGTWKVFSHTLNPCVPAVCG